MCIRDRPQAVEPAQAVVGADPDVTIEIFCEGADGVAGQAASTAVCREPVSYTHLRAHETVLDLVCRLLLEKNKQKKHTQKSDLEVIH